MLLEKCDGPPCPRCGCQDVDVLVVPPPPDPQAEERRSKYGVAWWFAPGRARCKNCGLRFSFRELPQPVEEPPAPTLSPPADLPSATIIVSPPINEAQQARVDPNVACPECGSSKVKVTSTRKLIRHHRCEECQARFKTPRAVTEFPGSPAAGGE